MLFLPYLAGALLKLPDLQIQKSLYQQIVGKPNMNNGYEDYIHAADVIQVPEAAAYLRWTPTAYKELAALRESSQKAGGDGDYSTPAGEKLFATTKYLNDMSFLQVEKLTTERFGKALDWVRSGNRKQCWDPREKISFVTLFPELSYFKDICRLIAADAYAKFADGDSAGAVADLLEGLTFIRRIGVTSLIGELVSISGRSILFASFQRHLDQLSETDTRQIVDYCNTAATSPNGLDHILQKELEAAVSSLDTLLDSPGDYFGSNGPTEDLWAEFGKFASNISTAQRNQVRTTFARRLADSYSKISDHFKQDESTWGEEYDAGLPPEPKSITSVDDMVDFLLVNLTPIFGQVGNAELKIRAQLRLLGLHARIIQYRWKNHHLPALLQDAIPAKLALDPMSKETFEYQVSARGGYKLYSRGNKATGPVELRYKPSKSKDSGGDIPPRAVQG